MQWLRGFTVLLLTFFYKHELLALFLILLVEESGVPMPPPGYTLLILAGARPGRTFLSALLVVAVASLAAFAGSYTSFYLTRRFGRERLLRYARFVRLKQSRVEQMERWMERHGRAGVFAGRLIPGLRTPTIFVAGLAGMRYSTYAIIDGIAAVLWAAAYFWLGAAIEPQWRAIVHLAIHALDNPWRVALLAAITIGAILGVRFWLKRQRSAAELVARALVEQRVVVASSAVETVSPTSEAGQEPPTSDADAAWM